MEVLMFSMFPSISKSRKVVKEITVEEYLSLIRDPGEFKEPIILARIFHEYGDLEFYDEIKKTRIPATTINGSFNNRRGNGNLKSFSGYMYLDVDQSKKIDLTNPLIFASWVSLSGTGRSVLVKVSGLDLNNFREVYHEIGKQLGLVVDSYAAKVTQLNVLSYDVSLYHNINSIEYNAQSGKKVRHSTNINKKETIGTVAPIKQELKLRFNDVDEFVDKIEFHGEAAILVQEKVMLSQVKIPHPIPQGKRNSLLIGICYQIRALNKFISLDLLFDLMSWINIKHCEPSYPIRDLKGLVQAVFNLSSEELRAKKNLSRRVFYNPDYDLSGTEKKALSRKLLNKERTKKVIIKIEDALVSWDFKVHKKITQKAVSEKSGASLTSVKKYYYLFEAQIEILRTANNKPP